MERKQDKRNLSTKQKIANAFKSLSKEKEMSKISVNDLIKYCKINRNTFYYHFRDIYDLINWISNEDVKQIVNNLDMADTETLLNRVFDYVEANEHLLNSAYNAFGREQLGEILHPHFYATLDAVISKRIIENGLVIDEGYKDFLIDFYSEGIANSMANYFKGTKHIDRKTLISYLLHLHDAGLYVIRKKEN